MTRTATVYCDCFERGACAPPPVPVARRPGGELAPTGADPAARATFEAWQHAACPHPGMVLARWEATVAHVHAVQAQAARLHHRCDRLVEHLATTGETVLPERAGALLGELRALRAHLHDVSQTVLRIEATGEEVRRWSGAPRPFASSTRGRTPWVASLGTGGLVIDALGSDGAPVHARFREGLTETPVPEGVVLTGEGQRVALSSSLHPPAPRAPRRLVLTVEPMPPQELASIDLLASALEVAAASGRPLRWA